MAESHLTLLYTGHLAGRLDRLPRLFVLIRQARAAASGPVTLLDLGHSCAPEVWECAATEGRAGLAVLDAMGYAAARLSAAEIEPLSGAVADRLRASVGMALCGPAGSPFPSWVAWQAGPWRVALLGDGNNPPPDADLIVRAGPDSRLEGAARTLWLVPPGERVLGMANVTFDAAGRPLAATFRRETVSADALPDPTIAAAVDLVRGEARHYHRMKTQDR